MLVCIGSVLGLCIRLLKNLFINLSLMRSSDVHLQINPYLKKSRQIIVINII